MRRSLKHMPSTRTSGGNRGGMEGGGGEVLGNIDPGFVNQPQYNARGCGVSSPKVSNSH